MIKLVPRLLPVVLFFLASCSSDGATGPGKTPVYDTIAGTYSGAMVGLSQGVGLNSIFSLTMNQNAGAISGSYGLSGTLSDGVTSVQVAGTGTLTGSIAQGSNPSVNLTIRTGACPNYTANFSGAYDSANHRLTITGPVEFFANNSCTVVLSYVGTIILNR